MICGWCHLKWKESETRPGRCYHCGGSGPEEEEPWNRRRPTSREPFLYENFIVYATWFDDFESQILYSFWQGRECVGRITISHRDIGIYLHENPACSIMPLVMERLFLEYPDLYHEVERQISVHNTTDLQSSGN